MKKILSIIVILFILFSCQKTEIFDNCYEIPLNNTFEKFDLYQKNVEIEWRNSIEGYSYSTIIQNVSYIKNKSHLVEIGGISNDNGYNLTCNGNLYMGVILIDDTITNTYNVLAIKPVIDGKTWNSGSNSPIGLIETDTYILITSNGIDSPPTDNGIEDNMCIKLKIYK